MLYVGHNRRAAPASLPQPSPQRPESTPRPSRRPTPPRVPRTIPAPQLRPQWSRLAASSCHARRPGVTGQPPRATRPHGAAGCLLLSPPPSLSVPVRCPLVMGRGPWSHAGSEAVRVVGGQRRQEVLVPRGQPQVPPPRPPQRRRSWPPSPMPPAPHTRRGSSAESRGWCQSPHLLRGERVAGTARRRTWPWCGHSTDEARRRSERTPSRARKAGSFAPVRCLFAGCRVLSYPVLRVDVPPGSRRRRQQLINGNMGYRDDSPGDQAGHAAKAHVAT